MEESFWVWFENLDPYTRELVVFEIAKKQQQTGRDLTDEELNEIRKKYEQEDEP